MLFHLIVAIAAVLTLALAWVLCVVLGSGWLLPSLLTIFILIGVGAAYLVRWLLRRRTAGDAGAAAAVQAVEARWRELVAGLHAAHVGEPVLRRMPWFVVLGTAGSGKTSLLQEAGLPWTSVGGTQVPARTVMATGAFGLWRTEEVAFLDVPGRWADDRRTQGEWQRLLHLLRRTRGKDPVAGIVLCVDLGDLLKKSEQVMANAAQALRDRCQELATRTGRVVPLYLVFTKSDALGGFKDFFQGIGNGEKAQVLGATLPWPLPSDVAGAWVGEQEALVGALRKRRLHALTQAKADDASRKLFQFPIQLHAAGRLMNEFINHLVRPGVREGAVLRGVYFTSCWAPAMGSAAAAAVASTAQSGGGAGAIGVPAGMAAASSAPAVAAAPDPKDLNASIFIPAGGGASPASSTTMSSRGGSDVKLGWFIRNLLGKVLPADRNLARPTRQAQRWGRRWRFAGLFIVPALAFIAAAWALVMAVGDRGLVTAVRDRVHDLERGVDPQDPKQVEEGTRALAAYGEALGALAARGGRLHPAAESAARPWLATLRPLYLDPALIRLQRDIDAAFQGAEGDNEKKDRLIDLFSAYRMLTTGGELVDAEQLRRLLVRDQRRWFAEVERGGPLSNDTQHRAEALLDLLATALLPRKIGLSSGDTALIGRIDRAFGDALWIYSAFDELISAVKGRFDSAHQRFADARADIVLGPDFNMVFSQQGWNDAVAVAIDEKSVAVARRLGGGRSATAIADDLRRRFEVEHARRWRSLLAGSRLSMPRQVDQLPQFIERATGPASPWRSYVRNVLDQMALNTKGTIRGDFERLPSDWIDPTLRAVVELRGDVTKWLTDTAGGRLADPARAEKTLALARRFDDVARNCAGQLLQQSLDAGLRDTAAAAIDGLVRSLWEPIDRELGLELDRLWRAQVLPVWTRDYAGRYPFAESDTEVDLAQFARLLNPVNGTVVQTTAIAQQLRLVRIGGRSALTVSEAYIGMLDRIEAMRLAVFAGSEQVRAVAVLQLEGRGGIKDMRIASGKQSFRLADRQDNTYDIAIRQDEPAGASLRVQLAVNDEWKTKDYGAKPWGLLRLLRDGKPQVQADRRWKLIWRFPVANVTQEFEAQAFLKPNGFERVAAGDLLFGFTCPDTLLPPEERYGAADAR